MGKRMFGKRGDPQKYSQLSTGYSDDDSSDADDGSDGDDFIQREVKAQQMQMQRQDAGLEMLGRGAERLSEMSLHIHEELGQQNKMLDEMDEELEDATQNLGMLTRKTKELIKKSGGKRNCVVIAVLTLIVVVLLFLIIYF